MEASTTGTLYAREVRVSFISRPSAPFDELVEDGRDLAAAAGAALAFFFLGAVAADLAILFSSWLHQI
jgi:hypothetical protein